MPTEQSTFTSYLGLRCRNQVVLLFPPPLSELTGFGDKDLVGLHDCVRLRDKTAADMPGHERGVTSCFLKEVSQVREEKGLRRMTDEPWHPPQGPALSARGFPSAARS